MKRYILIFLLLVNNMFGSFLLAQKINWVEEVRQIGKVFQDNNYSLELDYYHLYRSSSKPLKIDEVSIHKHDEMQQTIFKDKYEKYIDNEVSVKVDHDKEEIYIIFNKNTDEDVPLQKILEFDESMLQEYNLSFDSLSSDLTTGKLVFQSHNKSTKFEKLIYKYDPITYVTRMYSIYYTRWFSEDIKALEIHFEIDTSSTIKLGKQQYFQLDGDQLIIADPFKTYKIISNLH